MPTLDTRRPPRRPAAARAVKTAALLLALLLVAAVAAALWTAFSGLKAANARLVAENREQGEALAGMRQTMDDLRERTFRQGRSAVPPADEAADLGPALPNLPPPSNIVVLEQTTSRRSGEGLVATMTFRPSSAEPLGLFALVIRLPRTSEGRILDLRPVGEAGYTNAAQRVSEDGRFTIYQAHPTGSAPLRFELEVSGPVQATVRATNGLEPFVLDIRPDGAIANEI